MQTVKWVGSYPFYFIMCALLVFNRSYLVRSIRWRCDYTEFWLRFKTNRINLEYNKWLQINCPKTWSKFYIIIIKTELKHKTHTHTHTHIHTHIHIYACSQTFKKSGKNLKILRSKSVIRSKCLAGDQQFSETTIQALEARPPWPKGFVYLFLCPKKYFQYTRGKETL